MILSNNGITMKTCYRTILIQLFLGILINGQNNLPRLSPRALVGQTVGYTNIQIEYGSPGVKNRTIWGELVPYDEVWRTGANEATTIEFDKDVYISGNRVPAGKYSLFTIPSKKKWTVILNKVDDQWGAFKYEKAEDLLRFKVTPLENRFTDRLLFTIEYIDAYKANVILEWEKLRISFPINTELKE